MSGVKSFGVMMMMMMMMMMGTALGINIGEKSSGMQQYGGTYMQADAVFEASLPFAMLRRAASALGASGAAATVHPNYTQPQGQ
eukprot:1160492-Pelagomonas_calceolata.AAC.16